MATAEVRAVWQRAVNRCFVQEDAKRAPKLACCQSSCATSKLFDFVVASAADESDQAAVNVTLFNHKSSFSYVTPDSRWWLQLQPNYGNKKGLTCEQLNALEDEVEILKARNENKRSKDACRFGDENHAYIYSMEGMLEAYIEKSQANSQLVDMMAKHETMDIDSECCSVSKETNDFSMDSEYSWIGIEKAQPWWKTRDRDELACFVSHKTLNHIENCDLPPPRKYLKVQPCADISDIKIRTSSFDREAFSIFNVQAKGSVESGVMQRKLGPSTNKGNLYLDCDKYSRYSLFTLVGSLGCISTLCGYNLLPKYFYWNELQIEKSCVVGNWFISLFFPGSHDAISLVLSKLQTPLEVLESDHES